MRWLLLIAGIFMFIVGIFMFTTPIANLIAISLVISIAMITTGIADIVNWAKSEKHDRSGWLLACGILSAILGLWLLFGRNTIAEMVLVLPYIFSAWVLFEGIMRTVGAFSLKSAGVKPWGFVLTLGIIGIICGFALLYHPLYAGAILSMLLAMLFIYQGFNSVVMFFMFDKINKD